MSARVGKRVIVVVGMHRSGTSAITRGLQCLGVQLGDELLPPVAGDNDKGYWEDADVHKLNDDLLAHLGRDWSSLLVIGAEEWARQDLAPLRLRAVDMMRAKTANTNLFGLKNPRIALLLPFWKAVFEHLGLEASYVIAVRNPLSVARSMTMRCCSPSTRKNCCATSSRTRRRVSATVSLTAVRFSRAS